MSDSDVTFIMEGIPRLFRALVDDPDAGKIVTKFRDAGRRTPPTAAFSSTVAGRPQNAADGNRANRWEVPSDHRFYATKRDAELVEIKYYLQTLSMVGAPLTLPEFRPAWYWLLGHEVAPGRYLDPILLRSIPLPAFLRDRRLVQSGHYIPLARGGRHEYANTFLMLQRSNSLQGDLTFEELIAFLDDILTKQAEVGVTPNPADFPLDRVFQESYGPLAE